MRILVSNAEIEMYRFLTQVYHNVLFDVISWSIKVSSLISISAMTSVMCLFLNIQRIKAQYVHLFKMVSDHLFSHIPIPMQVLGTGWSMTHSTDMIPVLKKVKGKSLSRVRLFVTPWTVPYHVLPSMGFSRQGYWSGLPFPSPGGLPDPGNGKSPTL